MAEIIVEKFYLFFQSIMLFQVAFFGMIFIITKRKDILLYCLMILSTLIYLFFYEIDKPDDFDRFYFIDTQIFMVLKFALFLSMITLYLLFIHEIFLDDCERPFLQKMFTITKYSILVLFVLYAFCSFFSLPTQVIFYLGHIINGPFISIVIYQNLRAKGFKSLIIKGMIVIFVCISVTIYFIIRNKSQVGKSTNLLDNYPLLFIQMGMLADIFLFQLALLKRWNEQEMSLITKDYESKLAFEKMRNEISQQLHDDVGANLSSLNFLIEILKKKSDKAEQILEKITNNITETVALLSDTIWAINPSYDTLHKVLERVVNFGNNLLLNKDVAFEYSLESGDALPNLNAEQRKQLYLTLKEAINNIAKHAEATKVNLKVRYDFNHLEIELHDNGRGFDTKKVYTGNGLNNFHKRNFGSEFKIDLESKIGDGTKIRISSNHV